MVLWPRQKIMDHLVCFCLLDYEMLFFAHGLHESLVNEFSHRTPSCSILHHQNMIAMSDQVCDKGWWPVAVNGTFLVQQIFDVLPIAYHKRSIHESLQREDSSISLRPFCHTGIISYGSEARNWIMTYMKCPSALGI